MSKAVRAPLFDVDGTLVDSNYLHAVTWWEAFLQAGYDVPYRGHRLGRPGLPEGRGSVHRLAVWRHRPR
jgi:beta-phosphoglucomutase-like phosphatase (HAD superfamily)